MRKSFFILFILSILLFIFIQASEIKNINNKETPTPTPQIEPTPTCCEPIKQTTPENIVTDINPFSLSQILDKGLELTKIKKGKVYIWKKDKIEEVSNFNLDKIKEKLK